MNDAVTTHYKVTRRAWDAWKKAEQAYIWASNDYHRHGRKCLYKSDWVPLAAFHLAKKAHIALEAKKAYKAKESTFERVTKMRFFTPDNQ